MRGRRDLSYVASALVFHAWQSRSRLPIQQIRTLYIQDGDSWSTSYFMGTYYMLFPFLTCEVKSGGSLGLDIADRQNLHSMAIAVRGIVDLFRLVGRAAKLHRRVLAFSVSHDNENVRILGITQRLGETQRRTDDVPSASMTSHHWKQIAGQPTDPRRTSTTSGCRNCCK